MGARAQLPNVRQLLLHRLLVRLKEVLQHPQQMSFLTNPTAAALPQDELSRMSRGQLVQCTNVLHAGWVAASRQIETTRRESTASRQGVTVELRTVVEERDGLAEQVTQLSRALAEATQMRTQLERHVTLLHRACDARKDVTVVELQEKVAQQAAEVVQLERALRLRTPLETQTLRKHIELLEAQRDSDKDRMQADAVRIAELEERLRIAREDLVLANAGYALDGSSSGQPSPPHSPRGVWGDTRNHFSAQRLHSGAASPPRRTPSLPPAALGDEREASGGLPRDVAAIRRDGYAVAESVMRHRDASAQTETFMVKALDMLQQSAEEVAKFRRNLDAASEEASTLRGTVTALRSELKSTRDSCDRKDELIEQLSQRLERGGPSRSSSVVSTAGSPDDARAEANGVSAPSLVVQLSTVREKVRRLEVQLREGEKEARNCAQTSAELQRENAKLKSSMLALAEENASMSMQLQTVSDHSPKRLGQMMEAEAEVAKLREELQHSRQQARGAEQLREDYQRASKEVAMLTGRVTRYQHDIAALTTRRDSLESTVEELTAALSETRRELEDVIAQGPQVQVQALPPTLHNSFATLASLRATMTEFELQALALMHEQVGAAHAEAIGAIQAQCLRADPSQDAKQRLACEIATVCVVEERARAVLCDVALSSLDSLRLLFELIVPSAAGAVLPQRDASAGSGEHHTPSAAPEVPPPRDASAEDADVPLPSLGVVLDDADGVVRVVDVDAHGAAHYAGLRVGDAVLGIEGVAVRTTDDFAGVLGKRCTSTAFVLAIRRGRTDGGDEQEEEMEVLVLL